MKNKDRENLMDAAITAYVFMTTRTILWAIRAKGLEKVLEDLRKAMPDESKCHPAIRKTDDRDYALILDRISDMGNR